MVGRPLAAAGFAVLLLGWDATATATFCTPFEWTTRGSCTRTHPQRELQHIIQQQVLPTIQTKGDPTYQRRKSAGGYSTTISTLMRPISPSSLLSTTSEDLFSAVHRKEYEMKQFKAMHTSTTDPIRMAMSYGQETASPMRLSKALRRVYEDPYNPANPNNIIPKEKSKRQEQLESIGMAELGMRRGAFIVDIKRRSLISHPKQIFCNFDDAGKVAAGMVQLGADAVFVNTDYYAYGGDITELKSAVKAVRRVSSTAAVVMKDIVVDEIQLGIAKEAEADGIVLMSSVLGAALENFMDLATTIGLETIVECHTKNEVERALEILSPNIMVNNNDRLTGKHYPKQAIQLAGMFPGSGGPIICLATGGIETTDAMKRHLAVGYDGIVVGKAVMGSALAPELIKAVRDRTLLPAEFSQWGLDAEFDIDGNLIN